MSVSSGRGVSQGLRMGSEEKCRPCPAEQRMRTLAGSMAMGVQSAGGSRGQHRPAHCRRTPASLLSDSTFYLLAGAERPPPPVAMVSRTGKHQLPLHGATGASLGVKTVGCPCSLLRAGGVRWGGALGTEHARLRGNGLRGDAARSAGPSRPGGQGCEQGRPAAGQDTCTVT